LKNKVSLWKDAQTDELKTIDTVVSSNIPNTGNITTLNALATGTDYNTRTGRKILMKSLMIRMTINPLPAVSAPSGDAIRIIIFYDEQTNAAVPVISDVLQTSSWNSQLNLNNRDRFRVVCDKFIGMPASTYTAGALVAGSPVTKVMKKYRKFRLESIYNGSGATVAAIQTGGLFILYIAEANNTHNFLFESRVRFVDS